MAEPRKWNELLDDRLKHCIWTQAELADECNIARGRFANLLAGPARPVLHELEALAEALGVQVFELFLDQSNPTHQVLVRHVVTRLDLAAESLPLFHNPASPPGGHRQRWDGTLDDRALDLINVMAKTIGPIKALTWLLDSYKYEREDAPCSSASSSPSAQPPSASASSSSGGPGTSGTASTTTASP